MIFHTLANVVMIVLKYCPTLHTLIQHTQPVHIFDGLKLTTVQKYAIVSCFNTYTHALLCSQLNLYMQASNHNVTTTYMELLASKIFGGSL